MASGATLLLGLLSGSPAAVAVAVVLAVVGVGLRIEAAVRESRHS